MEQASPLPLPNELVSCLQQHEINPSDYTTAIRSIPRYIRLKRGSEAILEEMESDIKCKIERLSWLPSFYSLPSDVKIANLKAYKDAKIYGIDAASGAAVMALDISVGDHVLDLCAAPGAKLCMMLDILGDSGSATGVDVARHRLAVCRAMIQKYKLGDRCRLFIADGTNFSLFPPPATSHPCSSVPDKEDVFEQWTGKRSWKERRKTRKSKESCRQFLQLFFYGPNSGIVGLRRSELYETPSLNEDSSSGYDKVLVDAECTHDGSIRHIQKFEQWGWESLHRRVVNAQRTDSLTSLQLKLLQNGFNLLKVGGSLVYSTCSLTNSQNEDVVDQFLEGNSSAEGDGGQEPA